MEGTLRFSDPLRAEWVTAMFMLVVLLLAYTNVASPKKWRLLWSSFFTLRLGRQAMREDVDLQDRTLIGLLAAAVLVIGLFSYQVAVVLGSPVSGAGLFAQLLGAVTVAVVAQVLVLRLIPFLFQADGGAREYLYTLVLITVVLGLLLLPVVALVSYQPALRHALLPAGGVLVAALVAYRWLRAVLIGLGEGVSPRHVFLYLCAAEVLPVALAVHQAVH